MLAFALSALGVGKNLSTIVYRWLSSLSFWQLAVLALSVLISVQHFELITARHDSAKWQKQYTGVKAQLDSISSKKDVQRQVTHDRIVTVTRTIKEADGRAKIVENAPIPGNCKSPDAVLQADL